VPAVERAEVKAALAERFETVEALAGKVQTEERLPIQPPALTIMTRGFGRAGLATPDIEGSPLRDPLGGRSWVWYFHVRLWISLRGSGVESQRELDALLPAVVRALEADCSLGGIAVESAMASGEALVVRPSAGGNPMLLLTCDTAVHTEEPM
jgi:hypothetical protein